MLGFSVVKIFVEPNIDNFRPIKKSALFYSFWTDHLCNRLFVLSSLVYLHLSSQMSHDHMAHMMNVSSGHATHVNHASHESMDHSNMDESMMHSSMDHANMDHGSMNHEGHLAAASEACGNMGMHGMSVCIIYR